MRKRLEEKRQQREAAAAAAALVPAQPPTIEPGEKGGGGEVKVRTPDTPRKQWGEIKARPVFAQQQDATGLVQEGMLMCVHATTRTLILDFEIQII